MINRVELFNYHNLFDVDLNGEHHYVYAMPYYEQLYVGRHIYPDGVWLYSVTPEMYVRLVTMKRKNREYCKNYVVNNIDTILLNRGTIEDFVYLGDKKEFLGSLSSTVIQSIFQYYS